MFVPFGEYRPDSTALVPGATSNATNVIPGPDGEYLPLPGLVEFSSAITSRCRGAAGVRSTDGVTYMYAADAGKLYILGARQWLDKSKSGGYTLSGNEQWQFAQYGNQIIAAAAEAPVQVSAINGAAFEDLLTSARKPRARVVSVVNRDWVVLGNTNDATDGDRPGRVWWLARGDPTDADPDNTTQCDFEDMDSEDGPVQQIIGGEFGTIICAKGIYRMTYVGAGSGIYRFDKVVRQRGAMSAGSVIGFGRLTFFWDEDGPYAFDGVNSEPIGEGKMARTAIRDMEKVSRDWISSAIYPDLAVVAWAIPVNGPLAQRVYFYNWKKNRWSKADVRCERIFSAFTTPLFIDDDDVKNLLIDAFPQSEWNIDAPEFAGGLTTFGAFTPDHKMRFFSGPAMEALIETAELQPYGERRSSLTNVRPIIDGAATCYVAARARDTLDTEPPALPEVGLNLIGEAPIRAQGRYVKIAVRVPDGFKHAVGVDATFAQEGRR